MRLAIGHTSIVKNRRGQSMIEVIIAIGVITAGLFGTIAVIVTSVRAGRVAADRLTAMSLAREGIEIVRNTRDSNWLTLSPWDDGLNGPGGRPVAFPRIDVSSNATPMSLYFPNVAASWNYSDGICGGVACSDVYLSNNQYTQVPPSGSDTQFSRLMYVNVICQNASGTEIISNNTEVATCGAGGYATYPTKVGVRVISEVRWPNTSATAHKVILEERLYDWRWF
ncbi:MAG: hypothetical protein V1685_07525 [Parcubacteria group bacterium]